MIEYKPHGMRFIVRQRKGVVGEGGGGGGEGDVREENLLALRARSRSSMFSKKTKRKIKQRLCTG